MYKVKTEVLELIQKRLKESNAVLSFHYLEMENSEMKKIADRVVNNNKKLIKLIEDNYFVS